MHMSAPIKPPPVPKVRKRKSYLLRFIGILFTAGVIVFFVGSAFAAYVIWSVSKDLPEYETLAKYEPKVMTRIHANNGQLIAEYARERRIYVPINTVPDLVIKAFLSAEDKNFFQHNGIDMGGVLRAVIINVKNYGKRRPVGASTITQQVAKNFLLTSERSLDRKLKEAILAIRIERAFTKEQILELYLNEIYFGLSSYGIAAAALNYYGKSLDELNVQEAAYLAALPKGPRNYHPFKRTKNAISRRNWVIDRMADNNFLTPEETEAAKSSKLEVSPRPFGSHIFAAEYFAEQVRRELFDLYGDAGLYGGGLSVRTTLDPVLQKMARKSLVEGLVAYDRRHGWRGPVKQLETMDNWPKQLAATKVYSDIDPWKLAVILETGKDFARIGLRPDAKIHKGANLENRRGIIPLSEVKWARKYIAPKKRGKVPTGVDQLLQVGDVVYVAPRPEEDPDANKKKKKKVVEVLPDGEPVWQLMQFPEVSGGIIAMDPHTGRVHALVGGFSFDESEFDRVVQARRQPGSSFKPFVYAAALDNGYTPVSVVLDGPIAIAQANGDIWKPKNYGKSFYGPSTLRLGLEKSRNLMTVRLAQDMGMPMISEYARRFGIYDNLSPVLSMSLGAGETTLLRMTRAYSMLANGGKTIRATLIDRIQDRYGRTIWRHDIRKCPDCQAEGWNGQPEPLLADDRRQIVDPHTAYQITSMLEGVVKRGTGAKIKKIVRHPLAGKTGTTNEEKDAWFVGFTPDLTVGVYIGFDNPSPMGKGETGGGLAAPIFADFMKHALSEKEPIPFRVPPGIDLIPVDAKTGQQVASRRGAILEAFKPGTGPADDINVIGVQNGPEYWNRPEPGGLY